MVPLIVFCSTFASTTGHGFPPIYVLRETGPCLRPVQIDKTRDYATWKCFVPFFRHSFDMYSACVNLANTEILVNDRSGQVSQQQLVPQTKIKTYVWSAAFIFTDASCLVRSPIDQPWLRPQRIHIICPALVTPFAAQQTLSTYACVSCLRIFLRDECTHENQCVITKAQPIRSVECGVSVGNDSKLAH